MKPKVIIVATLLFFCKAASAQSWFTTGQNADLMISGVNFNNTGGALTFNHPSGLATDGTRLLVCDRFNNRVLVWSAAPAAWNTLPDLVLGQTNFTNNNPGISKSELNWPGNASLATNGTLAITDTENDRILIWLSFPTSNGQAAAISIHLPTVLSSPTPKKWPWGVWTDGTRLSVVATAAHLLLFWNTMPAADNQPPDYTIDLPQFGTPRNISTDGSTYFFVGDHNALGSPVPPSGSPGTFFWNSFPSMANQPYDFYRNEWLKGTKLPGGQLIACGAAGIFTWNTMPTDSIYFTQPEQTVNSLFYKNGDGPDVVFASNRIYVNNYNGNDVLVYDNIPTGADPNPIFAIGVSDFNNNTLDTIGYIQNAVPATDGTRLILTSDFDREIYIYNSLPASSGVLPDTVISLNMSPLDNVLFNNTFVLAGHSDVEIWNDASQLANPPSQTFTANIGTAVFSELKSVTLDSQFFYLADGSGNIFIWNGIPANSSVNPLYTLSLGNIIPNRISSDGTYFCVAKPGPPSGVDIYKVSDIAAGNLTPWKILNTPGLLNLASDAITFNGSLAITNTGNNNVLLWKDINDAGDTSSVIILGQPDLQSRTPAIGQNRLFMPAALLPVSNNLWVSEFKFSSRLLRFSYTASGIETNNIISDEIIIYPNPFSENATIRITNDRITNYELKIFDIPGKIVFQSIIRHQASNIHLDLPDGIYFLQANDGVNHYSAKLIFANSPPGDCKFTAK
ncbi:MAG: T9SS type A sorting domain-containing protein [Bacteroidetes bacterium]|nr:T9SS type A sorting domain-containing protein [Bacteroidota bacterium]